MNRTFELYGKASPIPIFKDLEGAEPASLSDGETLKAQLRSVTKIIGMQSSELQVHWNRFSMQ